MKNTKTKSWPFILSGLLLLAYSFSHIFSIFFETVFNSYYYGISLPITLKQLFRTSNLLNFIFILAVLVLAITLLFKKRNTITIVTCSIMLFAKLFSFLSTFTYTFRSPILKMIFVFLMNASFFMTAFTLVAALIMTIGWPKNTLSKFICFLPAIAQFIGLTCYIIKILVDFLFFHPAPLAYHTVYIVYIISYFLFFIALIFVGIAFKNPITKPGKDVVMEEPLDAKENDFEL